MGFVPYVGWLAPQVLIFYNLGERIVRSITFNIADFLAGKVSFGQGLRNVGVDTVNAFISFGYDQFHFFLPNIPLPPLPPIGPFGAGAGVTTAELSPETVTTKVPGTVVAQNLNTKADIPPVGTDVPEVKTPVETPAPTAPKTLKDTRLAKFIQSFTPRNPVAPKTPGTVQTLGEEQTAVQEAVGTTDAQTPTRPRGIVGTVSSAIRKLVSSAPHPVRDRAVPATSKKDDAGTE